MHQHGKTMPIMTKREYLAKAQQCEERASKIRVVKDRDWQITLARAYRMLAQAAGELAARRLSKAA
jgi:hypothetical protein